MHYNGSERRKYQRFRVTIPANIGLIDRKGGKTIHDQFKGSITDISIEGLGLELNYPGSGFLPFANKIVGEKKEFDLEILANLGIKVIRGIGEVKWVSMDPPYFFRVGVFLKEMEDDEKEKWVNFVRSQSQKICRSDLLY
ncbi:MAG: PilZ domain-containing protein [Syntrophobacterales bacterium]|nr:MAG: PilZ domain-containing protein [Syntrophobacterales bacterium]